jgi:hypothetical protein
MSLTYSLVRIRVNRLAIAFKSRLVVIYVMADSSMYMLASHKAIILYILPLALT